MKKLFILGICLLTAAGVSAQKSLVKEVEGKAKGYNADYAAARKQLAPALTNPETKSDAQTWFVAGNIEFGDYDDMFKKKAVGQAADPIKMGQALIDGYNYFMTAFPLDTVVEVDKNGAPKLEKDGTPKVKTKYSKDMAKKLKENHNQYLSAGQLLWDEKDYKNAYTVWNIYVTMPFNKSLGEMMPPAPDNATLGQIYYFEGLAAWQSDQLPVALSAFDKAIELGYVQDPALFDYAISVSVQNQDNPRAIQYAEKANELYGDSISKYLNIIINDKINNEKYDEAQSLLEKSIALTPDNPELYDVYGALYFSKKDYDNARKSFEKAVALNPDYAKASLDLGRTIYAQALTISEENAELGAAEYNKLRDEKIDPMLREAAPYLEKAMLDEENESEARNLLRRLYYDLNDEANMKRIEAM